jgi:hypothetical protein
MVIMKPEWEFFTKTIYDPAIFWTMVTAVATVLLVAATVALVWIGLIPLINARKAEFANRFRSELLSSSAKKIFFLVAHGFVEFKVDPTTKRPFFLIIEASENIIKQRIEQMLAGQRIILTFEIDDEILSPLEEVAYYEEKNVLDFDYVYETFADHIDVFMSNKEVVKYITWMRETTGMDVYRKLEKLHAKIKQHAAAVKASSVGTLS